MDLPQKYSLIEKQVMEKQAEKIFGQKHIMNTQEKKFEKKLHMY